MGEDDRRAAAPDLARVAEVLTQVRAAVRQEHAVAATVPADTRHLVTRLKAVQAARVLDEPMPSSHRGWLGRPISVLKRSVYSLFTKWYLQPLIHKQNAFNHAVALALQEIADRQLDLARTVADETEARKAPADDSSVGRA